MRYRMFVVAAFVFSLTWLVLVKVVYEASPPPAPPELRDNRCEPHPHAEGYWLCLS